MSTVRVWLSGWEWACCGDPFTVGDAVSFGCRPPRGGWWFLSEERSDETKDVAQFGAEFAASIELVEAHHDDGGDDRFVQTVAGTVRTIHAVVVDERVVRTPRSLPPVTAPIDLGNGFSASAGPVPPYVLTSEPVPGTARLRSVADVPGAPDRDDVGSADAAPGRPDPEDGAIVARSPGWVVDLEV